MSLQSAFIFLSPNSDSEFDRAVVTTKDVTLTAVAAANYNDAALLANELANQGITSIELCAGFGHAGTALIAESVAGLARVGVVRFDSHPGMDGVSGDSVFAT